MPDPFWLHMQTSSWSLALFAPASFFFVTGAAAYVLGMSTEQQDFSNNAPFVWEQRLRSLLPGVAKQE